MTTKMRRNFAGGCSARAAGSGAWRIICGAAHDTQVIVRGADWRAPTAFAATLSELGIEWQAQHVLLTMMSAGRVAAVEAASVIVHERLDRLYTALPLAEFDQRAQRFWRRVFFLVRIPGGRSLLGLLAHASRKRA